MTIKGTVIHMVKIRFPVTAFNKVKCQSCIVLTDTWFKIPGSECYYEHIVDLFEYTIAKVVRYL